MKIYSNILTQRAVEDAFALARQADHADIWIDEMRTWQPRAWTHGIEVWAYSLHGTRASAHGPIAPGPRDHLPRAAAWEDWGNVIARLYATDPRARIGHYKNAGDFADKVRADWRVQRGTVRADFLRLVRGPGPCRCHDQLAPACEVNDRSCSLAVRWAIPRGPDSEQPASDIASRAREATARIREQLASGQYPESWAAVDRAALRDVQEAVSETRERAAQRGDPEFVSPALHNARSQLRESEELLDRWADPIVFGKP